MCFTPAISLTTAIIELIIGIYLLKVIKDKRLKTLPIFVFLLGFYQLTEFFLCTTNNLFWAKLGFVVLTFLPIVLVQIFYDFYNKKLNKLWYIIPIAYSLAALFYPGLIVEATCKSFFVKVTNIFILENRLMLWVYLVYFALLPFILIRNVIHHNRNRVQTRIKDIRMKIVIFSIPASIIISELFLLYSFWDNLGSYPLWIIVNLLIILTSILITIICFFDISEEWLYRAFLIVISSSIITTLILFGIFPGFNYSFASIYCSFALLYALASILLVSVVQNKKYKRKK